MTSLVERKRAIVFAFLQTTSSFCSRVKRTMPQSRRRWCVDGCGPSSRVPDRRKMNAIMSSLAAENGKRRRYSYCPRCCGCRSLDQPSCEGNGDDGTAHVDKTVALEGLFKKGEVWLTADAALWQYTYRGAVSSVLYMIASRRRAFLT